MNEIQLSHLKAGLINPESVITSEMEDRFNQALLEILG